MYSIQNSDGQVLKLIDVSSWHRSLYQRKWVPTCQVCVAINLPVCLKSEPLWCYPIGCIASFMMLDGRIHAPYPISNQEIYRSESYNRRVIMTQTSSVSLSAFQAWKRQCVDLAKAQLEKLYFDDLHKNLWKSHLDIQIKWVQKWQMELYIILTS